MKNFYCTKIFIAILFFAIFSSCKKENICDCIKGTGKIITETRVINGFDSILVEDDLNVFITEAPNFEVKVEAGKNIVPLITTEVVNKTLIIKNNNRCKWSRSYDKPLNVYLKMPKIYFILSDGTGDIKGLNTITTSSITVRTKNSGNIELTVNNTEVFNPMHGAGDVTLHGTTINHYCDIGGTAFLYCKDLQTNYTWIHTFTTGLCYITTANLECKIDYIGDVYCYGHPVITSKTLTSTGQLYLR